MLGIMDKELKIENIPYGYSVCFNGDCALRETCMHYRANASGVTSVAATALTTAIIMGRISFRPLSRQIS